MKVEDVWKAARSVRDLLDVRALQFAFDSLTVIEVDSSAATQIELALGGIRQ